MFWYTPVVRLVPVVAIVAAVCLIGGCHNKHHKHHHAAKPKPPVVECHLTAPVLTGVPGRGVHQIELTWTKVEGATSYRVIRLDLPTESELGTTNDLRFRVKKLDQEHTYQFAVEATNGTCSARSNTVTLEPRHIPGLEDKLCPHGNG